MKSPFKLSLITLAILAPAAQAATDEIPLYHGEEVVVTATRFDAEPRIAANISVITRDDIRSSPALNLPDLLKTQAGIDVRPLYGNFGIDATVDLRGFGDTAAANTLILLDGQRLNPIDSGNISWSTIPMDSIRRIEILRGAGTVLYGDRASGGVINIVTDKSGTPRASVSASAGSYGYRSLDAYAAGGINSGYANIFGHTASSDGWRHNSQQDQQSVSGRAGLYVEKGEIALDYAAYRESSGLPGALFSAAYQATPRNARTPFDTQNRDGYRLRPGVKLRLSDTMTLEAELSDDHESQHWNMVSWGSVSDRDKHTQSITPRLRWKHGLGGLASETVLGYDYYDGRVDARSSAAPVQWAAQTSNAAYFQNSTALTKAWTVTLGGRRQRMDQRVHQDAYASWFTPAMDGDGVRTRNAYDLGASYDAQGWRVYAKVGSTFRFANTDELFGYDAFTFAPVFAGDLRPQYGTLREFGGSSHAGPVKLRGSLYRLDLTDEIGYDSASNANVNFDPTRRQGLEAEIDWQLDERFRTRLAYAYSDATFRDGTYAGKRVPLVPRSKASLQLTWNAGAAGSYSAVVNTVGKRIYSGDYANSRGDLAGYATLDLLGAWDLQPWKITARLLNAFDRRYAPFAGITSSDHFYYPADGRTFALTAGYQFK
jgi:iron complex outermembrane receptor protein